MKEVLLYFVLAFLFIICGLLVGIADRLDLIIGKL